MNKKRIIIIASVVGVLLLGGGVAAYTVDQNNKKEAEKMAMEKKAIDEKAAMQAKDATKHDDAITADDAMKKDDTAMSKDSAMVKEGSYVTLADYNSNKSKYADTKKVYFFHASWCSICQGIDKAVSADKSKLPAGITLIKTDFDDNTDLRKKYGVTQQYTFVQVDSNGNSVNKYSATTYEDAVAGIKA